MPKIAQPAGSSSKKVNSAKDAQWKLLTPAGREIWASVYEIKKGIATGRWFEKSRCIRKNQTVELGQLDEFKEDFKRTWLTQPQARGELHGSLELDALIRVLTDCGRKRLDGCLFATTPSGHKAVVMRQGALWAVRSDISDELFGNWLISKGFVEKKTVEQALKSYQSRKGERVHLGECLVALGALSYPQLQTLLAAQMVDRLLRLFVETNGFYRFEVCSTEGESQTAVLSLRDLVEAGLLAALKPEGIAQALENWSSVAFEKRDAELGLGDEDRQALQILTSAGSLSRALSQMMARFGWRLEDAQRRALLFWKMGCAAPVRLNADQTQALELMQSYKKLCDLDYFQILDLRRAASVEEVSAAYQRTLSQYGAEAQPGDSREVTEARQKIRRLLEEAATVLSHEEESLIYQRAIQLGLDHRDPKIQKQLRCEALQAEARALVQKQNFAEAERTYAQLTSLLPDDAPLAVEECWARFLAGPQTEFAAQSAIRRIEGLLLHNEPFELAYLTLARIHRLSGNVQAARAALQHVLELNPQSLDAQTEQRLLLGERKLKPNQRRIRPLFWLTLGCVLFMFVVLYVGANVAAGGGRQWPQFDEQKEENTADSFEKSVIADQLVRLQKERYHNSDQRVVPSEQRVMGNMEFYYQVNDPWWWIRRAILCVLGCIGLLALARENVMQEIVGTRPKWILAAVPYGAVTGFLSYIQTTTPLPVALGMGFFHTLAEQIFFLWFLCRFLRKNLVRPLKWIGIFCGIYGLYQFTYFAILQMEPLFMAGEVIRLAVFGGGAYALLLHLSGGLCAPFVAQLVMMTVMMLNYL